MAKKAAKRLHRGFEYCPSCEVKMRQTGRQKKVDFPAPVAPRGNTRAYVREYKCPGCDNLWEVSDLQDHPAPSTWESDGGNVLRLGKRSATKRRAPRTAKT